MAQGTRCYSIITGRSYFFDRLLSETVAIVTSAETGEAFRVSLDDLVEEVK